MTHKKIENRKCSLFLNKWWAKDSVTWSKRNSKDWHHGGFYMLWWRMNFILSEIRATVSIWQRNEKLLSYILIQLLACVENKIRSKGEKTVWTPLQIFFFNLGSFPCIEIKWWWIPCVLNGGLCQRLFAS